MSAENLQKEEEHTKPYCCPVCGGNGLVPNGFYNQCSGQWLTTSTTPEMCRSCNGTGVVWKPLSIIEVNQFC